MMRYLHARRAAAAIALAMTAGACSTVGDAGSGDAETTDEVVLVTHDSFVVDKKLLAEFERSSGLDVEVRAVGDAGTLVNQLVLSKDAPLGDVVYGIDNTFASRALDAEIVAPYAPPAAAELEPGLAVDGADTLTPVDYGDVCINVDREWFAQRGIAEPRTLQDLADPAYEDLLVVSDPARSSPGLAFLLATVDAFGDRWPDYWQALRDNGVRVADSWSDAYFVDFSGAEGKGSRPLVLSYASSPPYTLGKGDDVPPTRAMLGTCYRQVEYAGVLAGAANPDGARDLIDFLVSEPFQTDIPELMYVYPARQDVELPADWRRHAPLAEDPYQLDPAVVDANREEWIRQWDATVVG